MTVSTQMPVRSSPPFKSVERSYSRDFSLPGLAEAGAPQLRVALLTNEIPPYRIPLYEALASTAGWDFQVFTCIEREADRHWNVPSEFPFSVRRSYSLSYIRRVEHHGPGGYGSNHQVHIPLGLFTDLWRFAPHIIISAEFGARTLIGAVCARLLKSRLVVYFEGTVHTERNIGLMQRWLRRALWRAPHAYTVNGTQGREYLQNLGVPANSIFEIGQAFDPQPFEIEINAEQRSTLRDELDIQGQCFLYCGRLIPLKGIPQLLDAWQLFCEQPGVHATLLLIGEGDERARLEKRVAEAGLTNVRFLGHIQPDRLPVMYQAADVLVLPTLSDCWALVINEAMASGLATITSKFAGGAEIIVHGETGWVVDPLNRDEFAEVLSRAWEARDRLPSMRSTIRTAVQAMSIGAVADRIRKAIATVDPRIRRRVAPLREQLPR